jgi:hypothetical protein
MQMILKFKNKKAYDKCHTFINGNGFYFRTRGEEKMLEFCYEYTMLDVVGFCKGMLELDGQFEIVK